jgi:hypothetical protein
MDTGASATQATPCAAEQSVPWNPAGRSGQRLGTRQQHVRSILELLAGTWTGGVRELGAQMPLLLMDRGMSRGPVRAGA